MTYPANITSFSTKVDGAGNTILAAHMNAVQTDVTAVETELGTDPAGTSTSVKTRLAVSLADDGDLRLTGSSTLTISGGVITATNNIHKVDTESAAASDTLDTINGGADGYVLVLSLASASHVVTIGHLTGNVYCMGGRSIILSSDNDMAILVYSTALTAWRCNSAGDVFLAQDNSFTGINVFNEGGSATSDFRVESDTEANMILVDANADTDGALYLGGSTNGIKIAKAGGLSLIGTAKRALSLRPTLLPGKADKPTQVDRGASSGYSLPLYAADEELFIYDYIAGRWDGASDITCSVIGYLDTAETDGDDFALQLSWANKATGSGVWPSATTDVVVETNCAAPRNAQFSIFKVQFTIDWDGPATDVTASDLFCARLRRIPVAGVGAVEIAGEFVVQAIILTYTVDKMYKVA